MPNQKTTSEISWTFKIFRLFSVRKIECSRTGYHIFFKKNQNRFRIIFCIKIVLFFNNNRDKIKFRFYCHDLPKLLFRPKWNTWLQDLMKSYFLQTVFDSFDWLLTLTSKIRKLVKGLLPFCTTRNSSPLISAITVTEANYSPLWKNN